MAKEEYILKGGKFLPGYGMAQLQGMRRREKDPKAAGRLLVFIKRKEGLSIRGICAALDMKYTTVRNWLLRAEYLGISGRYDFVHPGAKARLSPEQLDGLREDLIAGPRSCGFETGVWTARLVVMHVKKRYGVQYAVKGMQDLLHRIGFSSRKPRPKNPKSAPRRRQNAFKKKAEQLVATFAALGYAVLAIDESSFINGWYVHNGWYPRGRPVTTPVKLSRKRFYMFGALGTGGFYSAFYDKANQDSFCDYLDRLHKKFGKVLLFADNASYHKSGKVREKLEEFGGDIVMEHILPYTPELNPVEVQWRMIKRGVSNTLYGTLDEMKKSIGKMMRNDEVKIVKMSHYLTA